VSVSGCYWLVGVEGITASMRIPVDAPVLVGRGRYNHLVLDDARLSRQHARVAPEGGSCVIYDLNSANGTFVNGTAVKRQWLWPNDLIGFGPCVFRLEYEPSAAGAPPVAAEDAEQPTLVGLDDVEPAPESASHMEAVDTLYSFMHAITKTVDHRELVPLIAAKVLEVYPAARYVGVHLTGGHGDESADLGLAHHAGVQTSASSATVPEDVRHAVLGRGKAVLASRSAIVNESGTDMYAPMLDRGEPLGILHVRAGEHGGTFSRADLDLLDGMASPAAIVLHNSRTHEESLVQMRLRHDLALAAQIQKSFLPREVIAVEGIDLFAEYRAAYTVGGDFYDLLWVGPDRLAVFIGDISGKGISGALLMARISSELRVAALAHVDPVKVLTVMNEATLGRDQPEHFFTAIYFTLDVKSGDIVLANAGHPTPYSRKADGTVVPISEGRGCAVGILDDPGFFATSLRLDHGDSLVLYTDGVIEAASADGALYGEERLEACLAGAGPRPPGIIAEHILRSVEEHAARGPVNDDLTLLICQRSVGRAPTMQPRRRSSSFPAPVVGKRSSTS
jgi:sigma-B regulation protein RsbU (phosphoserine phosphatase)